MSRSYANLLDLSGDAPLFTKPLARGRIPRSATLSVLSGLEKDEEKGSSVTSDAASSLAQDRLILVANMLPLNAARRADNSGWNFEWDEAALVRQLKMGIPDDIETILYVGSLKVDVDPSEQDEVASLLLDKFNCVPTFLTPELKNRFYHGFCKGALWPLFHYMLPLTPEHGGRFDRSLWQAYVSANKIFADKVMEIISPEDDYVWVHDYHLMVLPTFLRKRFNKVRLGFFLHSPFPSSEIYRTLPVRDEILRALLNADLIGFHTFDYARHFLSCCSRMLGLEYESKRGHIGMEYYGRTVGIKIMPVGVHMEQLEEGLRLNDTEWRVGELKAQFEGRTILLGVDDMDIFKGLGLKLMGFGQLLRQHSEWVGKAVLVQIANPARTQGREVAEVQEEVYAITRRINEEFGTDDYQPVVLLERHVPLYERIAFYTLAECCVVTAVRDGMNLIPYEYVVCRQGGDPQKLAHGRSNLGRPPRAEPPPPPPPLLDDPVLGSLASSSSASSSGAPPPPPQQQPQQPPQPQQQQQQQQQQRPNSRKRSTLVVSEFIGCSPSLSGAIRVNPWNVEAVADAMNSAITMPEAEQYMRHEKHFRYVSTHHVGYWATSFVNDLLRTCREHSRLQCYGIGFGLGFRTVALDPNFRKLNTEYIVRSYARCRKRMLLLDYDGTMMPQTSVNKRPSPEVVELLNLLCEDSQNTVFIVSGRPRALLADWFAHCPKLGLASECGYFYRWNAASEWDTSVPAVDVAWKDAGLPVLELYTESTDGSYIEAKESALVWHYRDADPDFGTWQAKELLDHLESVLANEPVVATMGHHTVEIKPSGVSKGVVVELLLQKVAERGGGRPPDFVLCVGDDRSDEDMFQHIETVMSSPQQNPDAEIFACTVGQKPSKAKYYLDDTVDVTKMLQGLGQSLLRAAAAAPGSRAASGADGAIDGSYGSADPGVGEEFSESSVMG